MPQPTLEGLLRELAPQVLGVLVRRSGDFDGAEDAVQEALLAAAEQWPAEGVPGNPHGWLVTVASRRLTDLWRSDSARRRRQAEAVARSARDDTAPPADEPADAGDDTLSLLFLCCHPLLTPSSQIALTLRAVGGLGTREIAAAFLVPEATMTRRISRAKRTLADAGTTFGPISDTERGERVAAVLTVLYLVFNEGYTATDGPELHRAELTGEAIRLTRQVHRLLPGEGEVAGLLALMLLTDARGPARTGPRGELVPLAEQDRTLWRSERLAEGIELITRTLPHSLVGPYQVQAAIAAVHTEAASTEETDWRQIVALYELLARLAPSPIVTLNHAVAVGMADGPRAGLDLLATAEDRLSGHHRVAAVRAHLLESAGDVAAARTAYLTAARQTTSLPEQRYLRARADRLA